MNLMITTHQKPVTDTQRRKRNSNMTLNSHEVTREGSKRSSSKKNCKSYRKTTNKMAISTYLSIVTLNVNELNAPDIEWLNGWKNKTHVCRLPDAHLRYKDTHRLKVRGWGKVLRADGNERKSIISDKIDLKTKTATRRGEGNGTPLQYSCLENPMDGGAW